MSETKDLTRDEAKQALNQGKKVKHRYFTKEEFIFNHPDGYLTDQNGTIMDSEEFWRYRSNGMFAEGWSIIE